ncbi:hypothetical protein [Halobacteriovorax sp. DA5]|uniref:hypothetical protein n=1 Tax=Halobacteriovorax sp. DA5 TaxID=2067553 RepID=UPI0011AF3361|nr:hypothetical protein [Halobacteriovorax sp. DA5]
MMNSFYIYILTFLLSSLSFAKDGNTVTADVKAASVTTVQDEEITPYMMIRVVQAKGIERQDLSLIRKSAMEIVLGTSSFEILMGDSAEAIYQNTFSLDISTKRERENSYVLNFKIQDIQNGKIVTEVSKNNVPRKRFHLEVRKLLYELFYGDGSSNLRPSKETPEKKKIKKKLNSDIVSAINSQRNSQVVNANAVSIFSVEESAAVEEIIVGADVKKLKNKKLEKKKKKKEDKVKISEFKSPDLDLRMNVKPEKVEPSTLTLVPDSFYAIGYLKETTLASNTLSTNETVDTRTNLTSINLTYLSNYKVEEWQEYFSIGGAFSNILSENPYGISPRMSVFGAYNKLLIGDSFFASVDAEYERISFANIKDRGAGVSGFANNVFWFGFGFKYISEHFAKKTVIEGFYKKALIGSSDLSTNGDSAPLDGDKYVLDFSVNLYKKFGLGGYVEIVNLASAASSAFDTSHQIFGVRLVYN